MNNMLAEINNSNEVIEFKDGLRKSYCGNCIDGKVFNPYTHKYEDCEYCTEVKKHNFVIKSQKYKSVTENNVKFDLMSNGFKEFMQGIGEFKFPIQSCIFDASKNFDISLFSLSIEYINFIAKENSENFEIVTQPLKCTDDFDTSTENLILLVLPNAQWDEIRYLNSLLVLRANELLPTIVVSLHAVNKFFEDVISSVYCLNKLKLV
mgnify:CR=1 FL=1